MTPGSAGSRRNSSQLVCRKRLPPLCTSHAIVDQATAGNLLPGKSVARRVAGDNNVIRIMSPIRLFGETHVRGVVLHAGVDWVDHALDVHATCTMHDKRFVLGEKDAGGCVRDRTHAVL